MSVLLDIMVETDLLSWEVSLVEAFSVTDQGQLDLFGSVPGDAADQVDTSPYDELIDAGWDPSDLWGPATDPDDEPDAWLARLPPDIRAELAARPPVATAPWEEQEPKAARAAFADGGFADATPPSWLLGKLIAEATREGYRELTDDELTGVLRAGQRQIAAGHAELAWAVAELAERRTAQSRRPRWSGLAEHVTDELAAELTLTGRSASRLLDVATGLRRLPEVHDTLLNGEIDWARACVFVDELSALDDAAAQAIGERLAERAAGWTTGQLRAALARAVLVADPDAAERRKAAARRDARVETWREPSGNAVLAGRELTPADVIAADAQLAADADWLRDNGVPGTLSELRAAAYLARLSGRELSALLPQSPADIADDGVADRSFADAADGGPGGRGGGPRLGAPQTRSGSVHLTMPLATLAGLSESPGEVAGYGLADAATCRDLAAWLAGDAATRWCLTVTGPDGTALAHACAPRGPSAGQPVIRWAADLRRRLQALERGTCSHARASAGYVPPAGLRHLVRVRQRRCSFRGCRRAAVRCDLDHTIPFDAGGPTCECNLAPLCRRHHRAKQAPGWHLTQHQPGVMSWRLPSGRTYITTGDAYAV
jgi:hypothetical protein